MISRVGIVGGCGGFGRAFADALTQSECYVVTMDRDPSADVVCDIEEPLEQVEAVASECDVLLLCMAQAQALSVLRRLQAPDDLLLVDICSVKHQIVAAARQYCLNAQYLSLHPMFSPERGFHDNNVVAVEVRGGDKLDAFVQLLQVWGARIVTTDEATHDQVTAVVQVLTHATLTAFEHAKATIDAPADLVDAMATPIFAELTRVAQGMLHENPELYHNIQTANPNGNAARAALHSAVLDTIQVLGAQHPDGVVELFERLRNQPETPGQ
jgi:prephenate dehydrogenase